MKVLILASLNQDATQTISDSITSLQRYGNYNYDLAFTTNGDLSLELAVYDVIIIHYSMIKFPFKYQLPISPGLSLKLRIFKGIKIAIVQDEQRSCLERLQFLNGIKIDHLFSVAPSELIEVLYPAKSRNFSTSTILTGYVTEQLLQHWRNSSNVDFRKNDVVFRGRILPKWYGPEASLKHEISEKLKQITPTANLKIDTSSDESDRLYGEEWLNFLRSGYVAVGTPSGSSKLDMFGMYSEGSIPNLSYMELVPKPINADYFVLSPRIFEYIASGCTMALTDGSYSGILIENRHYLRLYEDVENIAEILSYAKSNSGYLMRENCANEILLNNKYHISKYVEEIEKEILAKATFKNDNYSENLRSGKSPSRFQLETKRGLRVRISNKLRFFFSNSLIVKLVRVFRYLSLDKIFAIITSLLLHKIDERFLDICLFILDSNLQSEGISFKIHPTEIDLLELRINDIDLYTNVYHRKDNLKCNKLIVNLGQIDSVSALSSSDPYSKKLILNILGT